MLSRRRIVGGIQEGSSFSEEKEAKRLLVFAAIVSGDCLPRGRDLP
jgi:hypothetical protein